MVLLVSSTVCFSNAEALNPYSYNLTYTREHHQHDRNETLGFADISTDGVGSGALRAWLPSGIRTVHNEVWNDIFL